MGLVYLSIAIATEIFGTTMMKLTATLKSKLPILGIVVGYVAAFYFCHSP